MEQVHLIFCLTHTDQLVNYMDGTNVQNWSNQVTRSEHATDVRLVWIPFTLVQVGTFYNC